MSLKVTGPLFCPALGICAQTRCQTNPLEVPGGQQIELKMHEYEIEFGYSFGF